VIGVPGRATHTVIEQADNVVQVARDLAGLMVQVNTPDPHALRRHLAAVHDAIGVPLVVQDYPLVSGVRISQADLARVVDDLGEAVAGIKSEAPPTPPAIATLTGKVSVPVFGGLGGVGLIDELAAGAAGAMTGFSFPEALVATVDAFRAGGVDRARTVFAPWLPLVNFEAQAGISLAVRKEALRARGLMLEAGVRAPAAPFPDSLHPMLDSHLRAAQALLADSLQVA
jgi:4-hydroxy-tetrahydrodipicolinate synthase